MPIMFSYNLSGADSVHNNRIQSMLERFGWQNVGGSSYRYPPLAERTGPGPEDWFNRVIPALMLFRAYVLHHKIEVPKFSLDANCSTGCDGEVGSPPADTIELAEATNAQFGAKQLAQWLAAVTTAEPYASAT